jgi:serine protease inhibitor
VIHRANFAIHEEGTAANVPDTTAVIIDNMTNRNSGDALVYGDRPFVIFYVGDKMNIRKIAYFGAKTLFF